MQGRAQVSRTADISAQLPMTANAVCFAAPLSLRGPTVRARAISPAFCVRVRRKSRPTAVANDAGALTNDAGALASDAAAPVPPRPAPLLLTLWRFSRPHTVYGTVLSLSSVTAVAALSGAFATTAAAMTAFVTAAVPALLVNVYIVGLNQYYDIDIDRVNKPGLPLPSGAMAPATARAIIAASLVAGLAFCAAPGATPALRGVLLGSVVLGTLYSAPPFRLKRYALLASAAILTVRGVLVNVGFFLHAAAQSQAPRLLPPAIRFATAFFVLFGVVIALLKDVPDIRGDRAFGIRTFSVRLGARAVFRACVAVLVLIFASAAVFYFSAARVRAFGAVGAAIHLIVAAFLMWRARSVDTGERESVYRYYMVSWGVFYLEYLLLPLLAL